jgi:hypothetical protein
MPWTKQGWCAALMVEATLRAVCIDELGAYVVGDGGVALYRTMNRGWRVESTGVTANLRACTTVRVSYNGHQERGLFAPGDDGTVLHRSEDGNWSQETSGTQEDLHAVHDMAPRLFAVGDGGTFLVRTENVWRSIESHTDADLRAMHRHVAVGRGGAIIDCHPWPYTLKPSSRLACVPRPSPTTQDPKAPSIICNSATSTTEGPGGRPLRRIEGERRRGRRLLLPQVWPPLHFSRCCRRHQMT